MNIAIVGAGYTGLVAAGCFAEMGNIVTCVDVDAATIDALACGHVDIHEPGLQPLVTANLGASRLRFTKSMADALAGAEIFFIAVGTPPAADGSADVSRVLATAHELGRCVTSDCLVCVKSTVPVGTTQSVADIIAGELTSRGVNARADVVSNPEFLREGSAVEDFMRPERIIIGTTSDAAVQKLRALYAPFTRNHERLLVMNARDAEMTKYAANAMLATRISFMNEIAAICGRLGVDIEAVRAGIGSDSRIGRASLYAGAGYGGSCLPKDMRALIGMAKSAGVTPAIIEAVEARNHAQKTLLFEMILNRFDGNLRGKVIGVWGLAFKPHTDDVREAPALTLINQLLESGAMVKAHDPAAADNARRALPARWCESRALSFTGQPRDACDSADALALVTEWPLFRNPDWEQLSLVMRQRIVFDGRNIYDPARMRAAGFEYHGIGR